MLVMISSRVAVKGIGLAFARRLADPDHTVPPIAFPGTGRDDVRPTVRRARFACLAEVSSAGDAPPTRMGPCSVSGRLVLISLGFAL